MLFFKVATSSLVQHLPHLLFRTSCSNNCSCNSHASISLNWEIPAFLLYTSVPTCNIMILTKDFVYGFVFFSIMHLGACFVFKLPLCGVCVQRLFQTKIIYVNDIYTVLSITNVQTTGTSVFCNFLELVDNPKRWR